MTAGELARAVAHFLTGDEVGADRVEPWEHGVAVLSPSLPDLWDANFLRVDRLGSLDTAALAAEAERILGDAGARHRSVVVPDGVAAERLRPGFAALGWECDRTLFMVLRGVPRRRPQAVEVVEIGPDELEPLKRALLLDEPAGSAEVARQLLVRDERLRRSTGIRWFGVRVDGHVVASGALIERDGVCQIEDLGTVPAHRGRGLARAIVVAAAARGLGDGAEFVYLVAYRDDWPHLWYGRLGFEEVGMLMRFRRPAGAA
jgi:ribosomal protein S18 acetylase RimI-like enzyme